MILIETIKIILTIYYYFKMKGIHMKTQHRIITAVAFALAASMPSLQAFAQASTSIEPVNNFADAILGFMTGPLARAVGAIAIAAVGYGAFTGRMEKGKAFTAFGGIILVLGAPTIIQWLDTIV